MKTRIALALLAASTLATASYASITTIGTQAAFSASGSITQNTNWDTYTGFTYPGSPYIVGDLMFVEGRMNLIGGAGTGYDMARSLFTDNFAAGTTINIAGTHDLFAFNLGNFFGDGSTIVAITTNIGSYMFTTATRSYANNGTLTFVGYKADAGEYFTSVAYSGGSTGATDIQLGTAVPEPASWALMLAGFGMIGATLRRRTLVSA